MYFKSNIVVYNVLPQMKSFNIPLLSLAGVLRKRKGPWEMVFGGRCWKCCGGRAVSHRLFSPKHSDIIDHYDLFDSHFQNYGASANSICI